MVKVEGFSGGKSEGSYVWKKLTAEGGDFVDFAVSDDPIAYPDGGEQDGYWYEKVVEGVTPQILGFNKYAVDKFTVTSDIYGVTLSHSLGTIPVMALVYGQIGYENYARWGVLLTDESLYTNSAGRSGQGYVNNDGETSTACTTTTLYVKAGYKFKAGVEYTVITFGV